MNTQTTKNDAIVNSCENNCADAKHTRKRLTKSMNAALSDNNMSVKQARIELFLIVHNSDDERDSDTVTIWVKMKT